MKQVICWTGKHTGRDSDGHNKVTDWKVKRTSGEPIQVRSKIYAKEIKIDK